jgi:hypothetical protein
MSNRIIKMAEAKVRRETCPHPKEHASLSLTKDGPVTECGLCAMVLIDGRTSETATNKPPHMSRLEEIHKRLNKWLRKQYDDSHEHGFAFVELSFDGSIGVGVACEFATALLEAAQAKDRQRIAELEEISQREFDAKVEALNDKRAAQYERDATTSRADRLATDLEETQCLLENAQKRYAEALDDRDAATSRAAALEQELGYVARSGGDESASHRGSDASDGSQVVAMLIPTEPKIPDDSRLCRECKLPRPLWDVGCPCDLCALVLAQKNWEHERIIREIRDLNKGG